MRFLVRKKVNSFKALYGNLQIREIIEFIGSQINETLRTGITITPKSALGKSLVYEMLEITGLERYNGEESRLKLTSIESEMRECNKVNLNNEFILDLRERLNNPCRENWDYIEEALMPPKLQEYLNGLEDEVFINGLFEPG